LGFKFFWSFLGKPFDVTIVYWEANMMCNPKSYCNSCDSFIGLVSSCFLELAMMHQQFIKMESRIWYRYSFHTYIIGFCQGNFSLRSLSNHFKTWIVTFCSQKFIRIYVYFVCKHFQCQLWCEIISSYYLFV
jgi:hypothetical protein